MNEKQQIHLIQIVVVQQSLKNIVDNFTLVCQWSPAKCIIWHLLSQTCKWVSTLMEAICMKVLENCRLTVCKKKTPQGKEIMELKHDSVWNKVCVKDFFLSCIHAFEKQVSFKTHDADDDTILTPLLLWMDLYAFTRVCSLHTVLPLKVTIVCTDLN